MGVTPLTKRHWFFFCALVFSCSILAAFLWSVVSTLIAANPLVTPIRISIVGVCAFFLFFLFWLRFWLARNTWVSLWVYASPWLLTSSILLPILPLFAIAPLAPIVSLLLALWGYYLCFYPLIGLDTRLHRARFAKHHELADLLHHTPVAMSLLFGGNRLRHFFLVRSLATRRELGNMLIVGPTRSGKGLLATSHRRIPKHTRPGVCA